MRGTSRAALFGASFLLCLPGVRADETAIIVTSVLVGLLLLGGVIGVSLFIFYRKGGCNFQEEKPKTKKRRHKKHTHRVNGAYPPPPYHVDSRYVHKSNGFVAPPPIIHMPPPPNVRPAPHPTAYPTYHGPPPEFIAPQRVKAGTHSGPPPIVVKASVGTVTMRPDPRPVIKTRQYKAKDDHRQERHQHRSKSRERSRDRHQQEFVIQQSYDGIPVIRPVVYIDDDSDKRHRSKSKSRSKSRERPEPAKVITIPFETQAVDVHVPSDREDPPPVKASEVTRPRTPTPPPPPKSPKIASPERSRASSVTGGLNALRKSLKGHLSNDSDSDDSSKAPSFRWAQTERAPEPRAGDVMFFPANTDHTDTESNKPASVDKEQVYGYTTVIKSSQRDSTKQTTIIPDTQDVGRSVRIDANGGYEIPQQTRDSIGQPIYETELSKSTRNYNDLGGTMSDRLQSLVEDGDKTRFTRYNVGAIDFDDEKTEEDEPVQLRVRDRPKTPPADFPRDSYQSARPPTPPRDIPLITPRESTEIPPLDLQTSTNSQTYFRGVLRPVTPPNDYPVSPVRPKTPPTDFHTPRPPTPPRDIVDTNRSTIHNPNLDYSMRSNPVDPNTGAPGSFQARQRFIEAHLKKNTSPDKPSTQEPSRRVAPPAPSAVPPPPAPSVPTVHVPPGTIPPPPPPPPLPK